MAEALDNFTFVRTKDKPARFTALLDGRTWRVATQEEFDLSPQAFVSAIKTEAKKKMNRYVQTQQMADDKHVVVRAQPSGYVPRRTHRTATA